MKRKISMVLALLVGGVLLSYGQKTDEKVRVKFSGFVKTDFMYDTRQTTNAREGHFLILPAPENRKDGEDLNAQSNINFLSIQTRLRVKISGPDFFGMKTAGMVEGAFFGNSNATTGEFRLRHAFVKLSNDKIDIFVGQYWHPMFVTAVYPQTYSFSSGVPFQPFSRNPQLRLETKGKVKFIGVLFTERDFKTRGASVSQSGIPQLHAQLQFGKKATTLGGFGVNLKTVRPGLGMDNFSTLAYISYFRTKLGTTTWKAEATYGDNMSDLLQIGGIGVNYDDEYIATSTLSIWTEFSGDFSDSMEWGIFGGYTSNGGFDESVTPIAGFLSSSVLDAWRVAPRIGWKSGKLKLGIETEYTSAQYGSMQNDGSMYDEELDAVGNFRLMTTAIYNF
ncbi:MAG: hypothetical protein COB98_09365 [Flavobacteriaceae bacterium]|nr:MAG: hypothetical protein COB98_09365 [Flavobacteriaceae bacterium]